MQRAALVGYVHKTAHFDYNVLMGLIDNKVVFARNQWFNRKTFWVDDRTLVTPLAPEYLSSAYEVVYKMSGEGIQAEPTTVPQSTIVRREHKNALVSLQRQMSQTGVNLNRDLKDGTIGCIWAEVAGTNNIVPITEGKSVIDIFEHSPGVSVEELSFELLKKRVAYEEYIFHQESSGVVAPDQKEKPTKL